MGKRGRPRLPRDERRDHKILVAFTEEEIEQIRTAAEKAGTRPATWARRVLVEAAAGDAAETDPDEPG